MTRAQKALVLMVISTMGIWGCAKGPVTNGPTAADRVRALEIRVSKTEADFRTAAAARDQLRAQVASLEEQRAAVEKERDELRQQVTARMVERDALQVQYEQFRKNIRSLLGQAETAAAKAGSAQVTLASEVK